MSLFLSQPFVIHFHFHFHFHCCDLHLEPSFLSLTLSLRLEISFLTLRDSIGSKNRPFGDERFWP